MLSLFALETAMRQRTPLLVRGSALRWMVVDYDSALGETPVLVRCTTDPTRQRWAAGGDLEIAPGLALADLAAAC